MKNCAAKAGSPILPPLRSAKRRTFDERNEPVEALPRMIDKLSIDDSAKRNSASKLNRDSIARKEIRERNFKLTTSLYNIDGMSFEELQASLCRSVENPRQPFSFLTNISDEFANNKQFSTKPTDIDMQLAAVAKRIESSKILLEEAKSHIKDIYLRAKETDVRRAWKVDDGK
ncbi:PREDICTED: uncharacterized protein LOC105569934 [Vollenhovia emeryi]|uniref:uncharacterized protein LOC105569934 n=1 Tax=Vollenhovia emeryi TaxID=411798 RepID=UPI0005F52CDC|nr:PREDICTED: uncharacterized protein LOC105569934 [Vollenhovia emeryi]